MAHEFAVEMREVVKQFTTPEGSLLNAVDGVTMQIKNGEFFSMLGSSGCGKTTSLRMIAGFEWPTQGEVYIEGLPMGHTPPFQRRVNTVFQSYALFQHMTVFQNVAFGLEMEGAQKDEIEKRVKRALEMVQLTGMERRKPKQLSGGQQQRVAVARALCGQPAILLADEPTGNLDSRNGEAVMDLLRELHREGATICMVTHDPRYARYADRTVHLFDGKVVDEAFLEEQSVK
jgi:spermidine/putrescine transport system ATP-binding protein